MGNRVSSMLQDEEIRLISEETGFTAAQVERLYSRFTSLDKSGICGSLSRQDFLRVPELAINPLCDRIVHMFFVDCDDDHDRINFRQFMKVLATFRMGRSRNVSRQESLNYQQQQSILKQAPLLFDTIDPSQFSTALTRHSRHSSFHDGLHDHHHGLHQHHTTNQHSFHYAASSNHLPLSSNGHHNHHHNHNHNHHNNHSSHGHGNGLTGSQHALHENGPPKKHVQLPLVDPDEPANSRKQKLHFMFKIYDTNNDDLIDCDDIVAILKMMVGTHVDDARVHRIAKRTLQEADKNCDGYIDFQEFCKAFTRKDLDEALRVKFSYSS